MTVFLKCAPISEKFNLALIYDPAGMAKIHYAEMTFALNFGQIKTLSPFPRRCWRGRGGQRERSIWGQDWRERIEEDRCTMGVQGQSGESTTQSMHSCMSKKRPRRTSTPDSSAAETVIIWLPSPYIGSLILEPMYKLALIGKLDCSVSTYSVVLA